MLVGPHLASHSMPGHHSLDQMHFYSCFHRICPRFPCNSLHQPFPASAHRHRQLMWTQIQCVHNKAMRSVSTVAWWALLIPPTGSHFRFIVLSCLKPKIKESAALTCPLITSLLSLPLPIHWETLHTSRLATMPQKVLHSKTMLEQRQTGRWCCTDRVYIVPGMWLFVPYHNSTLTCHRVTLSTLTSQFTTGIKNTPTVVYTGGTMTVLASARFLHYFAYSRIYFFVWPVSISLPFLASVF
jgi:hypothetical protein